MPTKKTTSKGIKPTKPRKSKPDRISYGEPGYEEAAAAARREMHRWARAAHYLYCELFPWYGPDVLQACPGESPIMPWVDNSEPMRQVRLDAMRKWHDLTGLKPLDACNPGRWHTAAVAAGYALPDVQKMPLDQLAEIILTWAQAEQAKQANSDDTLKKDWEVGAAKDFAKFVGMTDQQFRNWRRANRDCWESIPGSKRIRCYRPALYKLRST
jgi:hypothetical protein